MVESAVDSDHTVTVVESPWTSCFLSDLAFSNPAGKSFSLSSYTQGILQQATLIIQLSG